MAINFPNSPSLNDTHTHNGLTYTYDGTIWKLQTIDATTTNEIIPYAYAHVRANTAGTGTNMSWGAYNSTNGDMVFTFDTALSDNVYYVLSEREQYDTHTVSIISKSTTGFTARWLDNSGTGPLSPDMFPGVLIVYASDPTKPIGGVGGGGDADRIVEGATVAEVYQSGGGTGKFTVDIEGTEAIQIDANRQILISGTQSGNNVAKIFNDTDGLGTGVLGVYASSNNANPRDVRFYSGGGTANEILRIGKDGQIGVGGDVGTAGEVLTSGGPSGAATWAAASGGGVTDGDKGDITVSNSGVSWNIDANTVGTTELSATGTADATTYLRGDNTWQTISSGASVTTSDTPPSSPSDGDLWWDSQNGRLLVYYEDVDSGQWVDASGRGVNNSVSQETGTFSLTVSPNCQNAAVSTGNYVKTGNMVTVDFNVYHNGGTSGDTNLRWGGQNGYFTINDTSLRPAATAGIFYNRRYFDNLPGNVTGTLGVWVGTCGVTPGGEIYTSSAMAAGPGSYGIYYFSGSWRVA